MKKFEFSANSNKSLPFSGDFFYNVYKYAEFLRHNDNIERFLCKAYELRQMLKKAEPGEMITVSGLMLEKNTPLIVKRTGPNVTVEHFEFTANRLTGLVAAYAFENRARFPVLNSPEPMALGLKWDNRDVNKCKLYLSAVTGAEHFDKQFQFWPLVCGLRKLQLNKITAEPIIKMAKIKNPDGVQMAHQFMRNLAHVRTIWLNFPGSSQVDLTQQLKSFQGELKKAFYNKN